MTINIKIEWVCNVMLSNKIGYAAVPIDDDNDDDDRRQQQQ